MPRLLAVTSLLALTLLVAGCTGSPTGSDPSSPTDGTNAPDGSSGDGSGGSALPSCETIEETIAPFIEGFEFDEATSASQEAQEEYEQRVCVYRSADATTAFGVTIAAIPFMQTELDGYAQRPNAIADDRLAERNAVLQTFEEADAADGHLDSQLYLIDTEWSITIQAVSDLAIADAIPALSVEAAIDAAFTIRNLFG